MGNLTEQSRNDRWDEIAISSLTERLNQNVVALSEIMQGRNGTSGAAKPGRAVKKAFTEIRQQVEPLLRQQLSVSGALVLAERIGKIIVGVRDSSE